VSAFGLSNTK